MRFPRTRLLPASRKLFDESAERMIVSALLQDYVNTRRHLERLGLVIGDLYFDHHQRVCQVIKDGPAGVFEAMRKSREDARFFGGWRPLAIWLAEVYESNPGACCEYEAYVVRSLSVRRRIIYRATELIDDACKASMSPEEYELLLASLQDAKKRLT